MKPLFTISFLRQFLFLSAALMLSACGAFFGRSDIETRYYTLDYIPTPTAERLQQGPYPFGVRLRDPTIAEAYRRSQIVYRQSAYQMLFYSYHLWAVDPDRMIGDLLQKHLRAARLFDNVTRTVEPYAPNYQLTCDIQSIEEFDGKQEWYAHLAVEYQLIDQGNGQVVWKKLFDLRKTVNQKEPVFVVRELSSLLETMHNSLIQELEPFLKEAKIRRAASDSGAASE